MAHFTVPPEPTLAHNFLADEAMEHVDEGDPYPSYKPSGKARALEGESFLLQDERLGGATLTIDHERALYPYCIVWAPLPLLTWLVPFLGHVGIANSYGVIRDFAGSCIVNEGCMAFGAPARYYQLDPLRAGRGPQAFNEAVAQASREYCRKEHNLVTQNCHSHVAHALNIMLYEGRDDWNMVRVAWLLTKTHSVGHLAAVKAWAPFAALVAVTLLVVLLL